MKRKLIKFSNYSYCITLPKQAVAAFGWKKGEELEANFSGNKGQIVISKKSKTKSVAKTVKTARPKSKAKTKKSGVQPIPPLKW